jgi:hypothetical protein
MAESYEPSPEPPTTYVIQTMIQEGRKKKLGKIEIAALEVNQTIEEGTATSAEQAITYLLKQRGIKTQIRKITKATQEFRRQFNLYEQSLGIDR